jgi:hypothetical protein
MQRIPAYSDYRDRIDFIVLSIAYPIGACLVCIGMLSAVFFSAHFDT